MLRALYGQFKRFLGWLNGGGYSVKDSVKQAENHRRDIESRYGGPGGDLGG
ncbi:MAG TPA: hypothetical protein VF073_09810 [Gaiella sp.]